MLRLSETAWLTTKGTKVCHLKAMRLSTLLVAFSAAVPKVFTSKAPGLALVGDVHRGEDPTLAFGADVATSVVIKAGKSAENSAELEMRRGGTSQVSFSREAALLPHTDMAGELSIAELAVGSVRQWSLWDLDTFDTVDSGTWSINDHSFCSSPNDQFLGGHCRLGAAMTSRRYTALPPHTRVRIRARVHFFDDWQGETVALRLDGNTVWAQSHEWCPGFQKWMCTKYGVNTCGEDTPDRLSVKAEASVKHSLPTLDIAFTSSLPMGTDACKTSWGVDDVSVELL